MQQLQAIIAHAWSDPGFKRRLHTEPAAVLAEAGIHIPASREIKVLTDDAKTVHLVLPQQPDELDDEQLEQAAGGNIAIMQANMCYLGW